MNTVRLTANLRDIVNLDEDATEELIGHEVSKVGAFFKDAFNLPKIEYNHTSNYAYYVFDVSHAQGTAILELMGAWSVFDARMV